MVCIANNYVVIIRRRNDILMKWQRACQKICVAMSPGTL